MTHGSLFSGIGGFDLAADLMGWENLFHCEWDKFCNKILNYYWPNAESFEDIKQTNFKKYEKKINVLSGGFPCQPYSSAGKRKGKNDNRHLWPEMLRAIREIKPDWIVGENVYGLVNWSNGLVFHEVQTDLEAEGYEVFPYLLPAASVGAPHRRDRIFFVAHTFGDEHRSKPGNMGTKAKQNKTKGIQEIYNAIRSNGIKKFTTNSNSNGRNQCDSKYEKYTSKTRINAQYDIIQDNTFANTTGKRQKYEIQEQKLEWIRFMQSNERNFWDTFPLEQPICSGNDGISNKLDGITFSKHRKESLKAYGNSVVPQLIYQIFKTIQQFEDIKKAANVGG